MRTIRSQPLLILLASLSFLTPCVALESHLSPEHRRWLDEVSYIIASSERQEFKALDSEVAREQFIQQFWKIRDPDVSTEVNEFRIQHYARIREANRRFYDGQAGWTSDRGRIFVMHGPPDDLNYTFGGDALSIDIANPTEVLASSGKQDRRRVFRLEMVRPETEIWIYRHLPGAQSVGGYFEVIFSRINPTELIQLHQTMRSLGGNQAPYPARLARDTAVVHFLGSQQMHSQYRILYAGEYKFPDIDSFYQSIFHPERGPAFSVADLQLGLRDLERSPGEVLQDKLRRGRRLKQDVETRISFEPFEMDLRFGSMRAHSGTTLLPVILGISPEFEGDQIDLLLELVRPDGSTAASVVDYFKVQGPGDKKPVNGRPLVYQTRLAARPGRYSLRLYAYLSGARRAHFAEHPVELPDYAALDVSMSDVMLYDKVVTRKGLGKSERGRFLAGSSPLLLKDHALMPATDTNFRRRENLTAFFEVYNPGLNPAGKEPSLNLICRLWEGPRLIAALPGRTLDYFTDSSIDGEGVRKTTYGLTLPLQRLRPGEYSLELEIHDDILDRTISRKTDFRVY